MSKIFPCGAFYSYVADEMFIEVPLFSETSPALKNSWLRAWNDIFKMTFSKFKCSENYFGTSLLTWQINYSNLTIETLEPKVKSFQS